MIGGRRRARMKGTEAERKWRMRSALNPNKAILEYVIERIGM